MLEHPITFQKRCWPRGWAANTAFEILRSTSPRSHRATTSARKLMADRAESDKRRFQAEAEQRWSDGSGA